MITLTDHAISRYHERVRPGLLRRQVKVELEQLVEQAEIVDSVEWAAHVYCERMAVISDGIALVLINDRAVTCVIRACDSEQVRERRKARKRKRREARRLATKDESMGRLAHRKKMRLIAEGALGEL